jgi:Ca2+-binding EF-hand superfamily protein
MSSIWKSAGTTFALIAALAAMDGAQAQTAKPAAKPAPSAAKPGAPATQQQVTAEMMFARWDKDKNNVLSLTEFKAGWQEVQANLALRQLHEAFVVMDANKSGFIEQTEYVNLELIRKAGASAPPMANFDQNKDGKLDFKEYVGMIRSLMQPKG